MLLCKAKPLWADGKETYIMYKTYKDFSILAAETDDTKDVSANPVPDGQVWIITKFKAADINNGDNKSSVYSLLFGSTIISFISVTGSTYSADAKEEITGDGVKKLSVMRYNTSGTNKRCPVEIRVSSIS